MFQSKVLIVKLLAVYRLATSSIVVREIPALDHEILNHAMEG